MKEEVQSFFDSRKESKNLAIEKKVKNVVFMRGHYKGQELSNAALCDTEYLKKALESSSLYKKTKSLINNHWQRPNPFQLFGSTTNQQVLQQKQLEPMHVQQRIQRPSQGTLKLHQQHFP